MHNGSTSSSATCHSEDQFTARVVGRWRDGSPVVRNPDAPDPAEDEEHAEPTSDFGFGLEDRAQDVCPFQAHIRRMYPREDLKIKGSERRRIMRAGIAYGEDEAADKGLFFVCYQNPIRKSSNSSSRNGPTTRCFPTRRQPRPRGLTVPPRPGIDLVIGQGKEARDGDWASGNVPAQVKQFVTSTGAEYFFIPSSSALRAIAAAR